MLLIDRGAPARGNAPSRPGLPAGTHRQFACEQVLLVALAEPCRDDGHVHLALVLVLNHGSEYHVGRGVCEGGDDLRDAVDLLEREILASRDVVHDPRCALDAALDQRR